NAVAVLQKEAAGESKRAAWARQALRILQKQEPTGFARYQDLVGGVLAAAPQGPLCVFPYLHLPPQGIDAVLERCAGADDPYLRAQVAFASNFWDGDRIEPMLLRLTRDDGRGERVTILEHD